MENNNNNINTLTFDNHDTYIYNVNEVLSAQQVELTPTNPEDTDTVIYDSDETILYTNGIKKGVIKFNSFTRSTLLNNTFFSVIDTIITNDGILMYNYANTSDSNFFVFSGMQIKTLATYKSGKYANYINVEIQIDFEDGYRIVTISY